MPQKVKIVSIDGKELPSYATPGSAGVDLRASIKNDTVLQPASHGLIPTGIAIELPYGYEAQVRARSGLAAKHAVTVLNGIGTIDSDYRGEIKVILINHGDQPFVIKTGDRIAQLVLVKHEIIDWQPVQTLSSSDRSTGSFGSTGKN